MNTILIILGDEGNDFLETINKWNEKNALVRLLK
jgi:hypothetical protein